MNREPSSGQEPSPEESVDGGVSSEILDPTVLLSRPEFFRLLIENMNEGLGVRNAQGEMIYANEPFCRMLGFERHEILGRQVEDFATDESRELLREEFRSRRQVLRSTYELDLQRKDGSLISTVISAMALHDEQRGHFLGSFAVVTNITRRRQAEEQLRSSEERFRRIFEQGPIGITVVDMDRRYSQVNPKICEMLGYRKGELLGRRPREFTLPEDQMLDDELAQQIFRGEIPYYQVEKRYLRKDGSVLWGRLTSTALRDSSGRPIYGVGLIEDITARRRAEERLQHEAMHDALTGLPNRALFMDRLRHALDLQARREDDRRPAVLFIDLDRFKVINDSLGHLLGDELLIEAARRLKASVRPSDTLARFGGDEFAVLLEDIAEPGPAVRVAERIQKALKAPFMLEEREVYSSASIGIAVSHRDTELPQDLLRDADTAMYRAKARGRAAYAIFDANMHAQVVSQLRLETELRRALEEDRLEVFFQPIVKMKSGRPTGYEALVRWRHEERGYILPGEFIHIAEESGLIFPLGERVLDLACAQLAQWQEQAPDTRELFISVNLSSRQLLQGDVADSVCSCLRKHGLEGKQLVLEVTEKGLMVESEQVTSALQSLVASGVRLALDDFGSGHSSLGLLQRFPFDQVKLDRWFVQSLGQEQGTDELVAGVMALCRWRQMTTVAEGVESALQEERLLSYGCQLAQGNFFAPPLNAEAASEHLATHRQGDGSAAASSGER